MNREDSEYLLNEDPYLESTLIVDMQDYKGEIFLHENNVMWCEDATYVALYEDDLEYYGITIE